MTIFDFFYLLLKNNLFLYDKKSNFGTLCRVLDFLS